MSVVAATPLTILHTSDWHLGRRLYGHQRYAEFEAFLTWLLDTIATEYVDVLIVAGDIFDTMTPSNRAQALYYEFLGKVSLSCCQHVVIVAGNHDSPSFLDAPSQLLKFLNVHVIGTACEDVRDEVLLLSNTTGAPQCLIAAVPYLRDRDVRTSVAGESAKSKDDNMVQGIRQHYDAVAQEACNQQRALHDLHNQHIPIIATGHLFAAGGSTTDDDGVRELYVGNLGKISADMFSHHFDYVALGHLHVPQKVGGCDHIRYSGSPIAMGFGEARQQKQVLFIQFGNGNPAPLTSQLLPSSNKTSTTSTIQQNNGYIDDLFGFEDDDPATEKVQINTPPEATQSNISIDTYAAFIPDMKVTSYPIPRFQELAQITGDLSAIKTQIQSQLIKNTSVWLEIVYTGHEVVSGLREQILEMVEGTQLLVLKIQNKTQYNKTLAQASMTETLQDLSTEEVFERCLHLHGVDETQKNALRDAYAHIIHHMHLEDNNAE